MMHLFTLILAIGFINCSSDLSSQATAGLNSTERSIYDPFPNPEGEKMIPIFKNPWYRYRYSELESDGSVMENIEELQLNIYLFRQNEYKFEYDNSGEGHILIYKEDPPDSSGIYIIGTYKDTSVFLGDTVLWLPQAPEKFDFWNFGSGKTMKLLSRDTSYLTENLFNENLISNPGEVSFEKHSAYLFKETQSDTSTFYYLRKGVGILGFERVVGNKTVAVGTLSAIYRNYSSNTVNY